MNAITLPMVEHVIALADEAKRGYVCDMGFGTGAFNGAKRLRPGTVCPAAALP